MDDTWMTIEDFNRYLEEILEDKLFDRYEKKSLDKKE